MRFRLVDQSFIKWRILPRISVKDQILTDFLHKQFLLNLLLAVSYNFQTRVKTLSVREEKLLYVKQTLCVLQLREEF